MTAIPEPTDPAWTSDAGIFARIHVLEGNPVELREPSKPVRDHEARKALA